jgi:hypothetical protein
MEHPRYIFSGSRRWTDKVAVMRVMKTLPENSVIVHGGASGLDKVAGYLAPKYGFTVEVYPAKWKKWGKHAGPRRNQEMVNLGAVSVFAFPVTESKGTWDLVFKACAAGIPVSIIPENLTN